MICLDTNLPAKQRANYAKDGAIGEAPRTERKRKMLSIVTDVNLPLDSVKARGLKGSEVLVSQPSGAATTISKHAQKAIDCRRNSAISPKSGL